MSIIAAPYEHNDDDLFVDLRRTLGRPLFLKCEGVNFAGSVKLKAAVAMVDAAERDGLLGRGSVLVESSSGNLGVALAVVAASRGLDFLCVTDPKCNESARRVIEALGSQVHTVTAPDPVGGFLGARLDLVAQLCATDPRYVWLNQYANAENWWAHYRTTGPAIVRGVPDLDVLFVGAGTTGTLMGCARYLRDHRPDVRVVAVDAVGSVSFGDVPGPRHIPGLGMSVPPPQLDASVIDDVVHVAEPDTVRACHRLAASGYLFGGSTGTVVSGALAWLDAHGGDAWTAVAVAPDFGARYLDTVYDRAWVAEHFGEDLLREAPGVRGRVDARDGTRGGHLAGFAR